MNFEAMRGALPLVLLLAARAPLVAQQEAVRLAELYRLAESASPRTAAARASSAAVAARESAAGLPPDPYLEVGIMGLSLPDLSADMPTSMVPTIRLMQMVPLPGRLGSASEVARQDTRIAVAAADETLWETRARIAMAFYEVHAIDEHLHVMHETLRLLTDLRAVAQARYASGEGRQSDVLRAGVAVARMDAEIASMYAMRAAAEATLAAALGDRTFRIPSAALSPLPAILPSVDTLVAWADESRPMLRGARAMVDRAEAARDLARRELIPDLTVGLEYGRQPSGMGSEHMLGLMVGFSVPVFASRRQLPMRAEMEAMQRMAEAELAQERAEVTARIRTLVAELERIGALLRMYRSEIMPQARANVESAFASYRSGAVDFMTVVDARMAVNEFEQEVHELIADYGTAISELEMTMGRVLPVTDAIVTEIP